MSRCQNQADMSCSTDYLSLNDQKLFKTIYKTLPDGIVKTQNVLTVKDDVLFVWNFQDSCILTLNLKAARAKDDTNVPYQILLPTSRLLFTPELLVVNNSCDLIAVAGPQGILVMVLPRRGVPHGLFVGGKECVYCKNYLLDERLFVFNRLVEVRQVRWHPASKLENHLLVLSSDNTFRLYVIQNSGAALVKIYQVGKQPMGILPGSTVPFLVGLGETAVDFDFGLPEVNEKIAERGKWTDLDWPIYFIRGNGEIYILIIDINDKKKPVLKGPLSMSCEDSSSDVCSIMCLKTTPPVIVICNNTGTIYHSVVLTPNDEIDHIGKKNNLSKHTNCTILPSDKALYMFETIELELGLAMTDTYNAYACPIFLHPDESDKSRYFCTHETGIHSINVPLVKELEHVIEIDEDSFDMCLPRLGTHSITEYILCTHANGSSKVNPILGFSLFHFPAAMIALLASGQVVSLPLLSGTLVPVGEEYCAKPSLSCSAVVKKMLDEPLDTYVQKSLKTNVNQPILKLSKDANPTMEELAQLLSRATQIFREEHFKKFDKIHDDIEVRVKSLQTLKEFQMSELKKITQAKQELQENAEKLAEKYEDIKDKQEEITKRCEKLLILVTQKQPHPTESEKHFFKELKNAENRLREYAKSINNVRSKNKYQELQMQNWKKDEKKNEIHLNSKQTSVIKNNLQEMQTQIAEMLKEIQIYKQELGLK